MSRKDSLWMKSIVWLWVGVFSWALIINTLPSSIWLEVHRVQVDDTTHLESPRMEVVRRIKTPFKARWTVTVMREGARGYYTFCTAHGFNDYRPENELPDDMRLDWWTWPTQCRLPEGRYYVNTLWVLEIPGFPEKEVRSRSNVFQVSRDDP